EFVVVGNGDLASDDVGFQFVGALANGFGENLVIVLVDGVIDASVGETEALEASGEFAGLRVLNDGEYGEIDALEHAGENEARLDPVLVRVHSDGEFLAVLRGVEHAEPGRAGGGKDDIGTGIVLGEGEFLA